MGFFEIHRKVVVPFPTIYHIQYCGLDDVVLVLDFILVGIVVHGSGEKVTAQEPASFKKAEQRLGCRCKKDRDAMVKFLMAPKISLMAYQCVRDKIVCFVKNVEHDIMKIYVNPLCVCGLMQMYRETKFIYGGSIVQFGNLLALAVHTGIVAPKFCTLVCQDVQVLRDLLRGLEFSAKDTLDQLLGLTFELVVQYLPVAIVYNMLLLMCQNIVGVKCCFSGNYGSGGYYIGWLPSDGGGTKDYYGRLSGGPAPEGGQGCRLLRSK